MKTTDSKVPVDPKQNRILAALPATDYARLLPDLEFVEMPLGWTMSESGDHVNFLHFPTSGIVSLIYALEDGSSSEIALVGNEGMAGGHSGDDREPPGRAPPERDPWARPVANGRLDFNQPRPHHDGGSSGT